MSAEGNRYAAYLAEAAMGFYTFEASPLVPSITERPSQRHHGFSSDLISEVVAFLSPTLSIFPNQPILPGQVSTVFSELHSRIPISASRDTRAMCVELNPILALGIRGLLACGVNLPTWLGPCQRCNSAASATSFWLLVHIDRALTCPTSLSDKLESPSIST